MSAHVYRVFDLAGRLLYIGSTDSDAGYGDSVLAHVAEVVRDTGTLGGNSRPEPAPVDERAAVLAYLDRIEALDPPPAVRAVIAAIREEQAS